MNSTMLHKERKLKEIDWEKLDNKGLTVGLEPGEFSLYKTLSEVLGKFGGERSERLARLARLEPVTEVLQLYGTPMGKAEIAREIEPHDRATQNAIKEAISRYVKLGELSFSHKPGTTMIEKVWLPEKLPAGFKLHKKPKPIR